MHKLIYLADLYMRKSATDLAHTSLEHTLPLDIRRNTRVAVRLQFAVSKPFTYYEIVLTE
jgi:hypothetical protein